MHEPATDYQALKAIVKTGLRRRLNRYGFLKDKRKKIGERGATRPKKQTNPVTMGLIIVLQLLAVGAMVGGFIVKLTNQIEDPEVIANCMGFALFFIVTCNLLFHIGNGNQDLGQVGWSLEWLFTFPVQARVLFVSKLAEQLVGNMFGWIFFPPFLIGIFIHAGFKGWSVPMALICALYINLIIGSLVLFIETKLRKRFDRAKLKNIQAIFTVLSSFFFMALFAMGITDPGIEFLIYLGERIPLPSHLQPFSIPVLFCVSGISNWGCLLLMTGFLIIFVGGSLTMAQRCVKTGLLTDSGAYQGERVPVIKGRITRSSWFRDIVAKDMKLLFRDRNLLVQTLLPPVFFVGYQFMANPKLLDAISTQLSHASAIAFGMGAYTLIFCSVQVLTVEGAACWMLYTAPKPIENLIFKKAILWSVYASFFPVLILLWSFFHVPSLSLMDLLTACMALVGIPVYSVVGACLGALGTELYEQNVKRKIKSSVTFLFMMLAGFYSYGLYAKEVWNKLGMLVLCVLLAYAMWQKVRDNAPYLLDPDAKPPPRLSLSDGLITGMAFFAIQGLIFLLFTIDGEVPSGVSLVCSFGIAGAIVSVLSYYIFVTRGTRNFHESVGIFTDIKNKDYSQRRGLLEGFGFGGIALAIGLAYLWGVEHLEWLSSLREQIAHIDHVPKDYKIGFAILAILLAPVFEEYIFRGLIYRGLRRTLRVELSILASAAIFAVVHPPISMIPVFIMGVIAAISFERTRLLRTPIIVHFVYNVGIIYISF